MLADQCFSAHAITLFDHIDDRHMLVVELTFIVAGGDHACRPDTSVSEYPAAHAMRCSKVLSAESTSSW